MKVSQLLYVQPAARQDKSITDVTCVFIAADKQLNSSVCSCYHMENIYFNGLKFIKWRRRGGRGGLMKNGHYCKIL